MPMHPAVWFPTIRADSGTDIFTERLASALEKRGIRTEITWLPHHAEYAPWLVAKPKPPAWATVVHCNSWLHQRFISRDLPLVTTIHSCVHDPAFDQYKGWAQRLYHQYWIRSLESTSIGRANRVTAVSRYTASRTAETFGHAIITPIYNWIDTQAFRPSIQQRLPGHPFRLLFVGNINKRKGADLLPAILHRLGDQFTLHYTGTEQDFSDQLPSNMLSLGRLEGAEALVKAYQNSDALLFPTRLEGFGLSVIEAQACGLPVISTYSSSIPEVVEDNKTALLCPLDDIDAFARAASRLRNEPGLWSRMSNAATERAKQFSEDAALTSYIEIYRDLTAR